MFRRAATAVVLYALMGASPALAQRTFASFGLRPVDGRTSNMQVTSPNATAGTTITGYSVRDGSSSSTDFVGAYATNNTPLNEVGQVFFNFDSAVNLGSQIAANMFFKNTTSAVASPITSTTGFFTPGFTGSIIFKPITSGILGNGRTYTESSILLAANFADGVLVRTRQNKGFGDSTGSVGDVGYTANAVSFYSDFLNFGTSTPDRGFSTSFTGDRNSANGTSFISSLTGTFDNAVMPTESAPPVPELATWGMMIVGFGAVGSTMRRRRTTRNKVLATA